MKNWQKILASLCVLIAIACSDYSAFARVQEGKKEKDKKVIVREPKQPDPPRRREPPPPPPKQDRPPKGKKQ
jgi:hypothetical protein